MTNMESSPNLQGFVTQFGPYDLQEVSYKIVRLRSK